jgi:hypothetical protein
MVDSARNIVTDQHTGRGEVLAPGEHDEAFLWKAQALVIHEPPRVL